MESSLESEVLEFFSYAQKGTLGVFAGPEGLAAAIILASAAASVYYFHRIKAIR